MKSKDNIHVIKCMNRLKEKYHLSSTELKLLENVENSNITSIAFTESGGFDKEDGEYHSEERDFNYKIRIKYRESDDGPEKILVLIPVKGFSNRLVS